MTGRLLFAAACLVAVGLESRAQSEPQPTNRYVTVAHDAAWTPRRDVTFAQARAPSNTARLLNLSVRARAGAGDATLIAGAGITGPGNLPLLVRAIGPGLAQFGVANYVREPQLSVYRGATLAASSNTVESPIVAASAYVGAFPPLEATQSSLLRDAGLLGTESAGSITAHCSAPLNTPGIALLEFYDAAGTLDDGPRLNNLSARAQVEPGESTLVLGFVVAGEGSLDLLLRGVGPSLAGLGVTGTLSDPVIELYAGSTLIASNDNWRNAPANTLAEIERAHAAVRAFALTSPNDAAMLVRLPAGAYTLQVKGAREQAGVALAEIHEVAQVDFDVGQATNAVGLDILRELARTRREQNLVLSPYSIESALALAYAGADGENRREMARVLRLPDDTARLQTGFDELRRALEKTAADSKRLADERTASGTRTDPIQWQAANRLFGQQDYAFRESFLTLMRDGFEAPLAALDFRRSPEPSRLTINAWVEEQTRQKIQNLIPEGALSADTRLVLVNALYLKAPWQTPFEKAATRSQPFRLPSGTSQDVPTMRQTDAMGYSAEEGLTIVTLEYLGRGLQFVIVLPAVGSSLDEAAAKLTPAHFARWAKLGDTSRRQVALWLPKFKVPGSTVPLGTALRALGMTRAFDMPPGSANFQRIAEPGPDGNLAMADVFHQTFIALDEEGTEAAAATAVVLQPTSAPPTPVEVRVDRPFLFAIQHRESGACLFLGRITDPR